jgi:hypothetical protein
MRAFVCEERSDTSERDGMAQLAYRLGFRDAVAWRIGWERRMHADALTVTREQIAAFEGLE